MKLPIATEAAHAKYGASKAERWLSCPGSIRLEAKAPPQAESVYAKEGTDAHACLEFLLKNRMNLAKAVKVAAKTYNQEMISHAEDAVAWVEEQMLTDPGAVLLSESRVDSSHFTMEGQFGTLDIAIVREFGRLTVIDYKYGAGVAVDADGEDGRGNPQLVYYGLALSHSFGHNFSEIELVVIQPRAHHHSGNTIRTKILTMEQFLPWEFDFKAGVQVCEQDNAPLKAGTWCRFCPAAVICPELKQGALKKAQVAFSDEKGLGLVPKPDLISLPHLGTILEGIERLEEWIAAVRAHAFQVLEKGGKVQGYKLVAKRGQRRWADEDASSREARKRFGDIAFSAPELISPAQLEKMAKSYPGITEWVKARVTVESSGNTLAPEADSRPAIRPMEEIFDDVKPKPLALSGRSPTTKIRKKSND